MTKTYFLTAALTVLSLTNSSASADLMGQYLKRNYPAGNTQMLFFAADFNGQFSLQNTRNAATHAKVWCVRNGITAARNRGVKNNDPHGNQTYRLAQNRHAVLGWYNLQTREMQFVGIQRLDGGKFRYMYPHGKTYIGSSFQHPKYKTNGYNLMIAFADDDRGGVAWRFEGPN